MLSSLSRDSHSVPQGSVLGPVLFTGFTYETLNGGMKYTCIVTQVTVQILKLKGLLFALPRLV